MHRRTELVDRALPVVQANLARFVHPSSLTIVAEERKFRRAVVFERAFVLARAWPELVAHVQRVCFEEAVHRQFFQIIHGIEVAKL